MTWKCPKCGREFARNEQDHYCIRPQTVEEYIGIQEERVQGKLIQAIARFCEKQYAK